MNENKLNFEESLKRLEAITRALEASETPLEEALKLFEEGTALVRALTGALDEATQRVTMLQNPAAGSVEEADFTPAQ
ncbi:MAG: exodeoxyribonuclease VII small subunit [Clostridia bacterium]|nr:exodeoxyribonuclease VII small subunit [Clostridia bacterium]